MIMYKEVRSTQLSGPHNDNVKKVRCTQLSGPHNDNVKMWDAHNYQVLTMIMWKKWDAHNSQVPTQAYRHQKIRVNQMKWNLACKIFNSAILWINIFFACTLPKKA